MHCLWSHHKLSSWVWSWGNKPRTADSWGCLRNLTFLRFRSFPSTLKWLIQRVVNQSWPSGKRTQLALKWQTGEKRLWWGMKTRAIPGWFRCSERDGESWLCKWTSTDEGTGDANEGVRENKRVCAASWRPTFKCLMYRNLIRNPKFSKYIKTI